MTSRATTAENARRRCSNCHKAAATVRMSWVTQSERPFSMDLCHKCAGELWNRTPTQLPNFRGPVRDAVTFSDIPA